jgi:hypothetical protein
MYVRYEAFYPQHLHIARSFQENRHCSSSACSLRTSEIVT